MARGLARVMEYEQTLHEIAAPTLEIAGTRKCLVFAASVAHAERLAEIFSRHREGCARWVCGTTPREERRQLFSDYARGRFQILVNVGVATEGFDDPGIEVVVMARPTKSRSLYAQMIGRGTRPLPGVIDDGRHMHSVDLFRRQAILESAKPHVEVVDFVGNAGRHRLVSCVDILGGNHSDDVVTGAKARIEREGSKDVVRALDEEAESLRRQREEQERRRQEDAAVRKHIVAGARYTVSRVDPFMAFGLQPARERGWDKGRPLTDKMRALLERQGVKADGLTFSQARQLITEITSRWDQDKCSYRQARILAARGLSTDVSYGEAKSLIDQIARREGWPARERSDVAGNAAVVADGRY
jgi:superfamily II DNA or RNA helicase